MLGLVGLIINVLAVMRIKNGGLEVIATISLILSWLSWYLMRRFANEQPPVYDIYVQVNMGTFFAGLIFLGITFF